MNHIRALAREAHRGQSDKLKRDYFTAHLTPIATGLREFGPEAEAAGWLHDIIEDTQHTGGTLSSAGVPETVVLAVESVTKLDGEPYEALIERACADPLGRLVKLVDNTWNLVCASQLAESDPDAADNLVRRKYRPARMKLLEALEWDENGPELRRIEIFLSSIEQELKNPTL